MVGLRLYFITDRKVYMQSISKKIQMKRRRDKFYNLCTGNKKHFMRPHQNATYYGLKNGKWKENVNKWGIRLRA